MSKVFFIINSMSNKSGTERVVSVLANLFTSKLGHQVTILNRDTDKNRAAYSLSDDVVVNSLEGNYFDFFRKLQANIREYKPDFIIIHNMGKLSLLCSLLNKYNAKLISLEHVAFCSRPNWMRFISRILYHRIDQVITLTKNDSVQYKSWFSNVSIIHNISPFSIDYSINSRKNKIISVGRLVYQKNFQALIMAWEKIQYDSLDWDLEIYGCGEDKDTLINLIQNKNIKKVYLKGQVENIQDIYKDASFFVMSSRYEGLPMVLLEAQSFGLPIISFDCPEGPSEVIEHNKNGFLVKNQDIDDLANAILELIHNSELRSRFEQQAFIDSKRFQQENILQQWKMNVFSK